MLALGTGFDAAGLVAFGGPLGAGFEAAETAFLPGAGCLAPPLAVVFFTAVGPVDEDALAGAGSVFFAGAPPAFFCGVVLLVVVVFDADLGAWYT